MANTNFFLNDLTAVDAPVVYLDRVTVSGKTTSEAGLNLASSFLESTIDLPNNFRDPTKALNFRLRFKMFDNYDSVSKTGLWFNNPTLTKFLKFKIIFFSNPRDANYFFQNPYETSQLKDKTIKIYSFSDFKIEDINETKNKSESPKTSAAISKNSQQPATAQPAAVAINDPTAVTRQPDDAPVSNEVETANQNQQATDRGGTPFPTGQTPAFVAPPASSPTPPPPQVPPPEVAALTPFYLYTDINIEADKINNIEFLSVCIFPYLDQAEICKEFEINLENTLDVQKFFFGIPSTYSLIFNKAFFLPTGVELVDLVSIREFKDSINFNFSAKKVAKFGEFFSDFFATPDFVEVEKETEVTRRIDGPQRPARSGNRSPLNRASSAAVSSEQDLEVFKSPNIVRFGFFFDRMRLVKESSIFPQFFLERIGNLRNPFYRQMKEKAKIIDIKVSRMRNKRVTDNGGFEEEIIIDRLNTTSREGIIYQIPIANVANLDFFSGIDFGINKYTYGEYKYKVNIKVYDPTYDVINAYKILLNVILNALKNYKNVMDQPIIQYNDLKDANPHIDSTKENANENDIFKFKRYGYNAVEDRYEYADNNNALAGMIEELVKTTAILHLLFTLDETFATEIGKVENITKSVAPNTGNPEGTKALIESIETLINKIEDVLVSATPRKQVNILFGGGINQVLEVKNELEESIAESYFYTTLEQEKIFNNFIFNVDSTNNFAFNYHTTKQNFNSGLLKLESSVNDIFEFPLRGSDRFKSLKNIALPIKQSQTYGAKYLKLNIRENVITDTSATVLTIDTNSAQYLDIILSLCNSSEFNSIIAGNENLIKLLTSRIGVVTNEEALFKLLSVIFSEGLDVITENKISIKTPVGVLLSKAQRELNTLYPNNNNIDAALDNFFRLLESPVYKNLSLGLLNYSKLDASNFLEFVNEINNYDKREIFYTRRLGSYSNSKTKLNNAGFFKLINNTFKRAKFINFEKITSAPPNTIATDGDEIFEPYYLLKNPILESLPAVNNFGNYLGFLQEYTDSEAMFNKNPYGSINTLNQFFLFEKQLFILSPNRPFTEQGTASINNVNFADTNTPAANTQAQEQIEDERRGGIANKQDLVSKFRNYTTTNNPVADSIKKLVI